MSARFGLEEAPSEDSRVMSAHRRAEQVQESDLGTGGEQEWSCGESTGVSCARSGLQLPSGLVRWVHSKLLRGAQDVQVLAADHRHMTAREVDVWRSVFVKEFAGRCSETRSMVKTSTEEPGAVARTRSRSQTALELERFDTVIEGTPLRNQTAWTLRNILRVSVSQGLNMGTIAPVPMKSKLVSFYNAQGALSRLIQERLSRMGDRSFWLPRPVWRNAGDCAGDGQSASAFATSKHQELSCSALRRL